MQPRHWLLAIGFAFALGLRLGLEAGLRFGDQMFKVYREVYRGR